MTWTFGVIGTGTSSQKKNTLRLLVTDTDTNRQLISDEGIYQLMTLEGNNLFRVAGSICRTLGDPRTVTRAVGDLRIGGEQFKSFQELEYELRNWMPGDGPTQDVQRTPTSLVLDKPVQPVVASDDGQGTATPGAPVNRVLTLEQA